MRSMKWLVVALLAVSATLFIGSKLISNSQELRSAERPLPLPIRKPPAAVSRQLESDGLVIPVELLRPSARQAAENQLEEYSCVIKNNTSKTIVAYALNWDVVMESGGSESSIREQHVSDLLIHPDFLKSQKSRGRGVAPGAEHVSDGGPVYFGPNTSVKRLLVSLDYVEFEDGTSLGPNAKGKSSQQIATVRSGASKYRNWLVQTYIERGASPQAVLQELQSESIPDGLDLSNLEKQAARVYRSRMLELYNTEGPAALQKILQ